MLVKQIPESPFKTGDVAYLRCRVVGHENRREHDAHGIPGCISQPIAKDGTALANCWFYTNAAWLIDPRTTAQECGVKK